MLFSLEIYGDSKNSHLKFNKDFDSGFIYIYIFWLIQKTQVTIFISNKILKIVCLICTIYAVARIRNITYYLQ